MKKSQFGLIFFIFLMFFYASTYAEEQRFLALENRWITTATKKNNSLEVRLMERVVVAHDANYPVAQLTLMTINKKNFVKTDLEYLVKIKKAFGGIPFSVEKIGKTQIYIANWKKANRTIKIFLKENPHSIKVSVALMRTAYSQDVGIETEIIQRTFADELEPTSQWLKKYALFEFLFSLNKSFAASSLGSYSGMPTFSLLNSSNLSPAAMGQPIQQLPPGGVFSPHQPPAQGNGNGGFSNSMAGLIKNSIINGPGPVVNVNSNVTGSLSPETVNAFNSFNHEFGRTNDSLNQMFNSDSIPMLAAATAVSATLGAMGANLMMDGIVGGGKLIWELVTHSKDESRLLENFEKARDIWEKTNSQQIGMEIKMDQVIALKRLSNELNLSREGAAEMASQIEIDKLQISKLKEKMKNAFGSDDLNTSKLCGKEIYLLEKKIQNFEKILELLENKTSSNDLCNEILTVQRKMRESESLIQRSRIEILAAQDLWLKKYYQREEKQFQDMSRAREVSLSSAKKVFEMLDRYNKDLKNDRVDATNKAAQICANEKNKEAYKNNSFLSADDDIQKKNDYAWSYNECLKKISSQMQKKSLGSAQHINELKEKADTLGKKNENAVEDMGLNSSVYLNELQVNLDWFNRLNQEQVCGNNLDRCSLDQRVRLQKNEKRKSDIRELCGD